MSWRARTSDLEDFEESDLPPMDEEEGSASDLDEPIERADPPEAGETIPPARRPIAALLLLLCLGTALHLLGITLERTLAMPVFLVDPRASVEADWGDGAPDTQLLSEVRWPAGPRPIFDPTLLEETRAALEAHPRVAEVVAVTREFPNRLRAEIRLRRPVAVVEAGGVGRVVDREGVVLARVPAAAHPELPRILTPRDPLESAPRPGASYDRSILPFRERPAGYAAVMEAIDLLNGLEIHREHPVFERHLERVVVGHPRVASKGPGTADLVLEFSGELSVLFGAAPHGLRGEGPAGIRRRLKGVALALARGRLNGVEVDVQSGELQLRTLEREPEAR